MEDEIKWEVSLVPDNVVGVALSLNGITVGPAMTPSIGHQVLEFMRLSGQEIADVVSKELGA